MIELTAEERLRREWGAEVRRRREVAGMSQQKLAQAVGVDQNTISRIERGVFTGSETTRMELARAFGCEVYDLFPYPSVLTSEVVS